MIKEIFDNFRSVLNNPELIEKRLICNEKLSIRTDSGKYVPINENYNSIQPKVLNDYYINILQNISSKDLKLTKEEQEKLKQRFKAYYLVQSTIEKLSEDDQDLYSDEIVTLFNSLSLPSSKIFAYLNSKFGRKRHLHEDIVKLMYNLSKISFDSQSAIDYFTTKDGRVMHVTKLLPELKLGNKKLTVVDGKLIKINESLQLELFDVNGDFTEEEKNRIAEFLTITSQFISTAKEIYIKDFDLSVGMDLKGIEKLPQKIQDSAKQYVNMLNDLGVIVISGDNESIAMTPVPNGSIAIVGENTVVPFNKENVKLINESISDEILKLESTSDIEETELSDESKKQLEELENKLQIVETNLGKIDDLDEDTKKDQDIQDLYVKLKGEKTIIEEKINQIKKKEEVLNDGKKALEKIASEENSLEDEELSLDDELEDTSKEDEELSLDDELEKALEDEEETILEESLQTFPSEDNKLKELLGEYITKLVKSENINDVKNNILEIVNKSNYSEKVKKDKIEKLNKFFENPYNQENFNKIFTKESKNMKLQVTNESWAKIVKTFNKKDDHSIIKKNGIFEGFVNGKKTFIYDPEKQLMVTQKDSSVAKIINESSHNTTSKYFSIDGYFKDDKSEFSGLIVKEHDDVDENDENIFYYGLSEDEIKDAIAAGENTTLDFVITNYKVLGNINENNNKGKGFNFAKKFNVSESKSLLSLKDKKINSLIKGIGTCYEGIIVTDESNIEKIAQILTEAKIEFQVGLDEETKVPFLIAESKQFKKKAFIKLLESKKSKKITKFVDNQVYRLKVDKINESNNLYTPKESLLIFNESINSLLREDFEEVENVSLDEVEEFTPFDLNKLNEGCLYKIPPYKNNLKYNGNYRAANLEKIFVFEDSDGEVIELNEDYCIRFVREAKSN